MTELVESYRQMSDYEKVATIDMGGTLLSRPQDSPSTHARLNVALGLAEQEEMDLYVEFQAGNGEINDHSEHARKQTELLRGLEDADIETYANTVQEILQDTELMPAAQRFTDELDEMGYTTVAVSSAPPAVTMPYADELELDGVYRWKDYNFTDSGLFDRVWVNPEAQNGKHEVVEGLQDQDTDVAHFGNGDNDKGAVKAADAGKRQWWMANPDKAVDWALKEAEKL
ncbi:HAD family hydrolase [Candidatus Nanosalina sp. VS9-1]|uniref:HAD family hydrolase n=1 Tax=Candidatus Nanosalina sp. VS9-1 TaxID=3388566 RepID=UPI0039E1E5A8